MIKKLHDTGVSSDIAFGAGVGSIALSILLWSGGKRRSDNGRRERTGIFVGLWAPTFFVIGAALTNLEN